jgi:exodeoxyribonuclease VIII
MPEQFEQTALATQPAQRLIGIFEGMSWDEYAAVDALSGSALMHMRRSPLTYMYNKFNPQPPTEAMKLGTVIHTAILEPPLLGKIAIWGLIEEQKVRRGKVWDAFAESNKDLIILTKSEQNAVTDAVDGAYDTPVVRKYLTEEGPTEVSMFWIDPYDGRYWKGRIDKLIRTKATATIVDLKKTRCCSPRRFGAQAYALGYHCKAAIYVSGYQILTGIRPHFKWIAMEEKRPNECAVYRATPDVILLGGDEVTSMVHRLDTCEKSDTWPCEVEQEEDLILPAYAMNEAEGLEDFALEEQG